MKNYYQTLQLLPDASQEEIKRAYRLYASKFHPDKHQGDTFFEERFKEVQEAYDVLSDAVRRASYNERIKPKTSVPPTQSSQPNPQTYQTPAPDPPRTQSKSTTNETAENYHTQSTPSQKPQAEKETPIRDWGLFIFWFGVAITVLVAFTSNGSKPSDGTMWVIMASSNIGFWIGGGMWVIGNKWKI